MMNIRSIPISDIIGQYFSIDKSKKGFLCKCPFCRGKKSTLYIDFKQNAYRCYACGENGDTISFYAKLKGISHKQAMMQLADIYRIPYGELGLKSISARKKRNHEMNGTAAGYFWSQLATKDGKLCKEYLENRKMSKDTIKKYRLGYAPKEGTDFIKYMLNKGFTQNELIEGSLITCAEEEDRLIPFFFDRVMFPFVDFSGNIVGFGGRKLNGDDTKFKYLNAKNTPTYSKEHFLFSMNFARNSILEKGSLILCEGNFDVISLNQAGVENAVASCGTALTSQQARLISEYTNKVYICYDNDEAGMKASLKAKDLLKEAGITALTITLTGAKDPDEYIKNYGAENFSKLIETAV